MVRVDSRKMRLPVKYYAVALLSLNASSCSVTASCQLLGAAQATLFSAAVVCAACLGTGLITSGQLGGTMNFIMKHPEALSAMMVLSCASSSGQQLQYVPASWQHAAVSCGNCCMACQSLNITRTGIKSGGTAQLAARTAVEAGLWQLKLICNLTGAA